MKTDTKVFLILTTAYVSFMGLVVAISGCLAYYVAKAL